MAPLLLNYVMKLLPIMLHSKEIGVVVHLTLLFECKFSLKLIILMYYKHPQIHGDTGSFLLLFLSK